MPLYEYKCSKCGSVFEVIQKVNEPPLKKCLQCSGSVHKVISPPALQFKGSGWYITDYAQKGSSPHPDKKPKEKPEPPVKTAKKDDPSSSSSKSEKS